MPDKFKNPALPPNPERDASPQGDTQGGYYQAPDGTWKSADGSPAPQAVADHLTQVSTTGKTGFGDYAPEAPGSSLNTTATDTERAKLSPMLATLQGQAQTGNGSWQQALAGNTARASGSAMALGQSNPSVGYGSALRNIGNAQGAVDQQSAGQANILRAQQRQGATAELGNTVGTMEDQQIQEAAKKAAALQGNRELNDTLDQDSAKNTANTVSGVAQAVPILGPIIGSGIKGATSNGSYSSGGPVPGRPKVFGDDEKNDTVPAWLSPGEIVIPRSHADSPQHAAQFVAALHASRGGMMPQRLAGGGSAGTVDSSAIDTGNSGAGLGGHKQAASILNGGLLDTRAFDNMGRAQNAVEGQYLRSAEGQGPSIAPQQAQNANDSAIAQALQAQMKARGAGAAAAGGATTIAAAQDAQHGGGEAAETTQKEQQSGQSNFAHAVLGQSARNLALADAQQQAGWRNTMANMGIGLAQQAQLRSILSGAGQGLASFAGSSGSFTNPDAPTTTAQPSQTTPTSNVDVPIDSVDTEVAGPPNEIPVDDTFSSGAGYAARGGQVIPGGVMHPDEAKKARDFVAALRRRSA